MTKKSSNTALSVVIVAALAYVAYKLLLPKLASASGARYSPVSAGSTSSRPGAGPTPPPHPSMGAGSFSPVKPGTASTPNAWQNFVNAVNKSQADLKAYFNGFTTAGYDTPGLDATTIPYVPLETLDTLPTTDILDPNILTASDYGDLIGNTGPDAGGGFSFGGDPGSADNVQLDYQPYELLDLTATDLGGGGLGLGSGFDPNSIDTQSPDLGDAGFIQ